MEYRPKINIEFTRFDKILELTGRISLIILWVLSILFYSLLPETIPTQFDGNGQAVTYGNKFTILVIPSIATILFIALNIFIKHPHILNYPKFITPDNAHFQYSNAIRMMRFTKLLITFACLLNIDFDI